MQWRSQSRPMSVKCGKLLMRRHKPKQLSFILKILRIKYRTSISYFSTAGPVRLDPIPHTILTSVWAQFRADSPASWQEMKKSPANRSLLGIARARVFVAGGARHWGYSSPGVFVAGCSSLCSLVGELGWVFLCCCCLGGWYGIGCVAVATVPMAAVECDEMGR